MALANQMSPEAIERFALDLKTGACPKCSKRGASVDVYKAHRIWSAVILSSWGLAGCSRGHAPRRSFRRKDVLN